MGKLKELVDDLFGPMPKEITDIPHNEQNDDVFNSENSPPQDHMVDDSVAPNGIDPFYGTHTQTVEEVTGYEAKEAHSDFKRGMRALIPPPFLSTREFPSDSWAPRQITIDQGSNTVLVEGRDDDRLRITIINASTDTVYLSNVQGPAASVNSIPLPSNSSLTLASHDWVYVSCPTATSAAPVVVGAFTER